MKNFTGIIYFVLLMFALIFEANANDTLTIEPGAWQLQDYIKMLQGKKVGVVMNQASVVDKVLLPDTLLARGIMISKIFSPEHGFKLATEAGVIIDDDIYGKDRIAIISLYGKNKKPSKEEMKGLDILVFDIQDVGVRFYTYLSTLHYTMQACAENNVPVIILDRPNPNGFYIDGPVLEKRFRSFIGMHPVPVVYGMTIGEYALMIKGEKWISNDGNCMLTVIPCKNYTHKSFYNLPVNPSPNLREMRAVYLYPSLAFFEGTVVSEGRGTNSPFLVVGHPGYPVHDFSFKPEIMPGAVISPKFRGEVCYGFDLRNCSVDSIKDKRQIDLHFLIDMYSKLDLREKFFTDYFNLLGGTLKLKNDIMAGKSEDEIRLTWQTGLKEFKKIRVKYLLYPDFE
jgi:uncharacterized protein YbbC (DUF1343 family)